MRAVARALGANGWMRRRLSRRGQGGYALLMTLMIMAISYLMVGALLFYTLSSASIGNIQLTKAREWRAADGAMDAAVTQILQDPNGATGSDQASGSASAPPCQPIQRVTIGGVDVDVKCETEASDLPFVPESTNNPGQKVVNVVGDKYRGDPTASVNSNPARNWQASTANPCLFTDNCYPWVEAMQPLLPAAYSSSLAGASPTVRHTGGEALQIVGDIAVKRGAAVLRNDRDTTSAAITHVGPGLAVRGEYSQGDAGLMNTVTGAVTNTPPATAGEAGCGILSPNTNANNVTVPNASVVAVGGLFCQDTTTTAARPDPAGKLGPEDSPVVIGARPPDAPPIPLCPGATPTGGTIYFEPGSYNADKTRMLNEFLSKRPGDGCSNRRLVFKPGEYWFDVNDPTAPTNQRRNELQFADDTLTVIFGTETAGLTDTSAATTPLCDATRAGVLITLSERTSIRHSGGRVGICAGNNHTVALQQTHAVNVGWETSPTSVTGGTRKRCENAVDWIPSCWFSDLFWNAINWVAGLFGGSVTWDAGKEITGLPVTGNRGTVECPTANLLARCYVDTFMTLSGFANPSDTVGAPINAAELVVESTTKNTDINDAYTRIDVLFAGATTTSCSVTFRQAHNRGWSSASYDLLATTGSAQRTGSLPMCGDRDPGTGKTVLNDRKQLYTSTIGVQMTARRDIWSENTFGPHDYGIEISKIKLRTPMTPSTSIIERDSNNVAMELPGGTGYGTIWKPCWQEWDWFLIIPYPVAIHCDSTNRGDFYIRDLMADQTYFNAHPLTSGAANPPLTALGVDLGGDSITSNGNFYDAEEPNTNYVRASLMQGNTSLCSTQFKRGPGQPDFYLPTRDWGRVKYLSLLAPQDSALNTGDNGCKNYLQNADGTSRWKASDLIGKTIKLEIFVGQTGAENFLCKAAVSNSLRGILASIGDAECSGWGYAVEKIVPRVSFGDCKSSCSVSGMTVATAYDGPSTPFNVSQQNEVKNTFNVVGDVSLPRADFDVIWGGAARNEPVVAGNMWVNGIGSWARKLGAVDGKVGVLCCVPGKPAERIVRLEAWVGDTLRGVAKVRVSDTNIEIAGDPSTPPPDGEAVLDETWKPGVSTRVEYWQLCNNAKDPGADRCART